MRKYIAKMLVSFEGSFIAKQKSEPEIIATIQSEECSVLWQTLKQKMVSQTTLTSLIKKYAIVNGYFYTLFESVPGATPGENSIVQNDSFYVLRGGYSL